MNSASKLSLILCLVLPITAQAQDSPYVDLLSRDIKALSDDRAQGLLSGSGLGYALAAELNGYPGPTHVLELAEELELSDQQIQRTQRLFDAMSAEAKRLGRELVEAEAELNDAFASGRTDARRITRLTTEAARIDGELRATHLRAHIEMLPILTQHQAQVYQVLRGYTDGEEMDHSKHGMDH